MNASPLGANFNGMNDSNPADILRGERFSPQQDDIPKKGHGDMVGQMLEFLQRSSMSGLISMFQNSPQNTDSHFPNLQTIVKPRIDNLFEDQPKNLKTDRDYKEVMLSEEELFRKKHLAQMTDNSVSEIFKRHEIENKPML